MNDQFLYFDSEHAVRVHDWIIENSGGRAGINDLNLLHGPLEHIQNDDYYPSLEEKLTHLIFSINKNHAFSDGNKRSSIALGAYFLELNGYEYCIQYFVQEMENIAVWIADNMIDKELLHHIIVALVYEDDYPEWLKLSITHAISRQNN
jgi:death on curing protein